VAVTTGNMAVNRTPIVQPVAPHTVLVVEDDGTVASAIDLLLHHYGYALHIAPTLAEARRLLSTGAAPHVVVLDLNLPDGSGLDLLEQLRSDLRRRTRVIVLTATVDPDQLRRLKRLRPERFLRKPMNFLDLLDAIRGEVAAAMAPAPPASDMGPVARAA
jgi:CheY-like chemotaxis protein